MSGYCKISSKVFAKSMKERLCERIDKFCAEVCDEPRTDEEWMTEFKKWSEKIDAKDNGEK